MSERAAAPRPRWGWLAAALTCVAVLATLPWSTTCHGHDSGQWPWCGPTVVLSNASREQTLLEEQRYEPSPTMDDDVDPLASLHFVYSTNRTLSPPGPKPGVPTGENVFFIKVSRENTTLDPDELCGLESALRLYGPRHRIYLLTTHDFQTRVLDGLEAASGLRIHLLRWHEYLAAWRAAGTLPHMMQWYDARAWRSGFVLNNLSNAFRLILLYNHGGAYFDLDIVHMKAPDFPGEFLAWQARNLINNAALRLRHGSPFLLNATAEFAAHFNGNKWGHNGPTRLTQSYAVLCPDAAWCSRITLLNVTAYYPIPWKERYQLYIRSRRWIAALTRATLGVHLWKAAALPGTVAVVGRESAVHWLANNFCPYTLRTYGREGLVPSGNQRNQTMPTALDSPPSGRARGIST